MPFLPPLFVEGSYTHPRTRLAYDYAVTCQIATDGQARESMMQIRGKIARGAEVTGFVVTRRVDPANSFLGREQSVALECVAVACERDVAAAQAAPASTGAQR